MLRGVNDTLADARELVRLLRGIPSLVNLIPFNPWPGAPFESSDLETIRAFQNEIHRLAGDALTINDDYTKRDGDEADHKMAISDSQLGNRDDNHQRCMIKCSVRTPRGRDILAACGQLAVVNNAKGLKQNNNAVVTNG